MHTKEIEKIIGEYLNNESAEYAILIDGEWGSGKTYFLTHSLMKILEGFDDRKWEKKKCAYVSLYGLKSIDEVARNILFQCIGTRRKKNTLNAGKLIETAGNVFTIAAGAVNIDLSKIKDIIAQMEIKDWIICFDDLERSSIPLNDILGYMNQLVEYNKCKMIILANEKEIGKRIEGEENAQELYRTVREKVMGLTIRFEPQMKDVYDSIMTEQYKADTEIKRYLVENKEEILMYFNSRGCTNIRTLKIALGSIGRVYTAMEKNNYTSDSTCKKIMDSFVRYIIYLTIYLRDGNEVNELGLTTSIGYVQFEEKGYGHRVKAYKFLEKYCTTMSFSETDFIDVVTTLRKEYKEQEVIEEKQRAKDAVAYRELQTWYLLEDEEVKKQIALLWEELKQNKYYCEGYQEIVGLLIILEDVGFMVGDFEELIQIMNRNIEQAEEITKMNLRSYPFSHPELQEKYDRYVNMLTAMADNRKQELQVGKLNEQLDEADWFGSLKKYCLEHQNDFTMRNGFIDLLDMETLLQKIKAASVSEIRCLDDILATVYIAENIRSFFLRDKEKLQELLDNIKGMKFSGINKPMAQEELERCIEKILKKLQ